MSLPTPSPLEQQAAACLASGNYAQAALLYEQLVATEPDVMSHHWRLGIAQLLQGQESEAQLIWTMAMAEGSPEENEQWTVELLELLYNEADHQEAKAEKPHAWLIRQYIREIDPTDLNNLLRIVQLSLQLEQFSGKDLRELGLIDLLQTAPLNADTELLETTVRQVLEYAPEAEEVAEWVAVFLPLARDRTAWIDVLLDHIKRLSMVLFNHFLATRYAELCLQVQPVTSQVLLRLSSLYQDIGQYEKGIALAEQYFAGCQTTVQRLIGNSLILRGLMISGGRWQLAEKTLDRMTQLIETLLAEYRISSNETLDTSILCSPVFFYPYIGDRPAETRPLQNRLAALYQNSVYAYLETYSQYQPYPKAPLTRSTPHEKIRVGYLSRCMRMHSVGWLSRWVFEYADRDRFDIYAYFNQQVRLEPFSQRWFADNAKGAFCLEGDLLGVAQKIREDEIDILVDLDSLTSDLGCGIMALKPAPIQVTWLGLDATGLPAIDYFIADPYVLPEGAEAYYSEKIWRFPQTYIAVNGFEVGAPTIRRDQLKIPQDAVIYFSAQISFKRHPETVRRQMQILKAVPNSYFLIKGVGDAQALQTFFTQMAEAEGVERDRLRFLQRDDNELTHRANLSIADVVLDTFPYNGATTTLETLWMGIPLVTQVGQQFASRNSYGMLMNAGIHEGIAYTPEEYVEWGIRLGQDANLRQQIHWRLLQSRHTAPLWNARQFTRELETAYEQMWQRYLDIQ